VYVVAGPRSFMVDEENGENNVMERAAGLFSSSCEDRRRNGTNLSRGASWNFTSKECGLRDRVGFTKKDRDSAYCCFLFCHSSSASAGHHDDDPRRQQARSDSSIQRQ